MGHQLATPLNEAMDLIDGFENGINGGLVGVEICGLQGQKMDGWYQRGALTLCTATHGL